MTIRILDILNFSNRRNPQADSGIQLKKELISSILSKRSDFFFYLLAPKETCHYFDSVFANKNVQIIPLDLLARQQGGAFHFDARALSAQLNLRQIDIDVLFVNQPELTAPLLDYFNKVHFFDVHSFGYVHWMDWKKADRIKNRWNLPTSLSIITSVLLSAVTGCNSHFGKTQILMEAARWFTKEVVDELENKIIALWPGINSPEIRRAKTKDHYPIKTIIFPFRTQKYTGFKSLVEIHLVNLWKRRQDFRLLLTNPSDYDYVKTYPQKYPFIEVAQFNRKEYLNALWQSDIVVGCHNGSNQWSLSAVEAVAAECVPLFNKASFFPEMITAAAPEYEKTGDIERYLYFRGTFVERIEALLDNLEIEQQRLQSLSRKFRRFYNWDNRVDDWIACFEMADAAAPEITQKSQAIIKIENLLKNNGGCSKEMILRHMDWHPKSRQISWTKYRKLLRRMAIETPNQPEVFFTSSGSLF